MRGEKDKRKIFRDATQGYIQIPSNMVAELVDTFEVQRLKDVAQTGIRPIYSGATHDRFSHSVGVYNIGVMIYERFQENLIKDFESCGLEIGYKTYVEELLTEYEPYYHTACILHDIGHPALSHTFEYIYDSKYLSLKKEAIQVNKEEIERLYKAHQKKNGDTHLKAELKRLLRIESQGSILVNEFHASQHEMMGAYLILSDQSIQASIKNYLKREPADFAFISSMIIGAQYELPKLEGVGDIDKNKARIKLSLKNCVIRLLNGMIDADSIDYLNRNTHFAGYSTSQIDVIRLCNAFSAHFDTNRWIFEPCMEKSAMSVLEGFISARHYEPRWLYSHHKIVYYEAFLVKYLYKKTARYLYALDQSFWDQQSVLWLNSIVGKIGVSIDNTPTPLTWAESIVGFNNVLIERCSKDLSARDIVTAYYTTEIIEDHESRFTEDCKHSFMNSEDKIVAGFDLVFLEHGVLAIPNGQETFFARAMEAVSNKIRNGEGNVSENICVVKEIIEKAKKWTDFYANIRDGYYAYLMAPVGGFQWPASNVISYKTSDSDINALFKQMYLHYRGLEATDLSVAEQQVNTRFDMYKSALEEYHTRKYRQSLWKTEEEYELFLVDVEKQTGMSRSVINKVLINFIIDYGYREEFDDPESFDKKDKRTYKAVYFNWDHATGEKEQHFSKMFSKFGPGMVICIYGFHFKDFGKLKIRFEAGTKTKLVSYSELVGNTKKEDKYLPYIYFQKPNNPMSCKEWAEYLGEDLKKNLVKYLLDMNEEGIMNTKSFQAEKGKIIRDSVHGDIFVPERFLDVVDSRVFQRLRRIKQLSTADYVFPEANHTRFAHSLGTFHIMMLMMDRICALFDYLHIEYTKDDRDVILMAALLHDIGHGPYSHAFEKLSGSNKSHEEWTCEIIEKDSELKKIFERNFRSDFAISVTNCLKKKKGVPDGARLTTLQNVFSMLISSQLDADRLDYLVRDSFNTGVKLGVVDLQKIISALELTMHNDKLSVCISEDALSAVEQLIVGRFNMYDSVYFSPYKAFSEELMCKIVERISKDPDLPSDCLFGKIKDERLTLEDYIQLDDSVFQSELYRYQHSSSDPITKEMITDFFNRSGYSRLRIMDESALANSEFIDKLERELNFHVEDVYGIVHRVARYSAYDGNDEDSILIVGKNGVIENLDQRSKIVGRSGISPRGEKELWETTKSFIYVNYDILQLEDIDVRKMQRIVDDNSLRKHTEIEEKYSCDQVTIDKGKDTRTIFDNPKMIQYQVDREPETKKQEDVYFDTDAFFLAKSEASLRRRRYSDEKYVYTVKRSIDPNNRENGGQFIRSEFELEVTNPEMNDDVKSFITNHLSDMFENAKLVFDIDALKPRITICNNRTSYDVRRKNSEFLCEVSLDAVTYHYGDQTRKDWQIEIELKSLAPIHRVELKGFADSFRDALEMTQGTNETLSKYEKALKLFGLE